MVYDYVVTLKNRNARLIDNISILLCVISLLVFLSGLIRQVYNPMLIMVCVLMILVLLWNFFMMSRKLRSVQYNKALMLAGLGWVGTFGFGLSGPAVYGLIAIPLIVMAFIEKPAKADLEIGFSTREIVMNSLIKRRFEWQEFNNIMLKDDLLTMDFKNNKIFQRQTIEDDPDASEDEFNEFCAKQLLRLFSHKAS